MSKCWLCGPVSHNEADFTVGIGSEDCDLNVCRWCEEDLELYGVRINQIIRLEPSKPRHHFQLSSVLGPVYSPLEQKFTRENTASTRAPHSTRNAEERSENSCDWTNFRGFLK